MSFDYIQSEEAKLIFLYCCLFPEDFEIKIESLVRCGIGAGLFADVQTINEARTRVKFIIDNLMASNLLLSTGRRGYVKMHDVIRDVAIYIALAPEHGLFVKAAAGLENWPKYGIPKNAKRISLMDNQIYKLPHEIEYQELLTLFLQGNYKLREIPDNFFAAQESLKVLDLNNEYEDGLNLFALSASLSCLKNLRMFYLKDRQLNDISILAELPNLEILSLRGSSLKELPQEIRKLSNLRIWIYSPLRG